MSTLSQALINSTKQHRDELAKHDHLKHAAWDLFSRHATSRCGTTDGTKLVLKWQGEQLTKSTKLRFVEPILATGNCTRQQRVTRSTNGFVFAH